MMKAWRIFLLKKSILVVTKSQVHLQVAIKKKKREKKLKKNKQQQQRKALISIYTKC